MPAGVVSCWRAEGTASDSTGNNNGVLAGDTSFAPGRIGASFHFDGDRDGVLAGTGTNLHLQNFTIEAWIKRASASMVSFNGNSNGSLFAIGTHTGGLGFWIQAEDSCLVLGKSGGSWIGSSVRVADTNWHHVAVTKQAERVVFYLDGVAFPTAALDVGEFIFAAPACIGSWLNRAGQFDNSFYGSIDELAVCNRELSAAEIVAIYAAGSAGKCATTNQLPICINAPSGLLSWWRGEDNAFDSIHANHGTLAEHANYGPGRVGKGFVFEGQHAGVCIGPASSLQLQDFSIEAWIKRASPSVCSLKSNEVASIFSLDAFGGGFAFYLRPDDSLAFGKLHINEAVSNARISDTNWHHVVLTKTGNMVVFYLDAVGHPATAYDSGGFAFHGPGYIGGCLSLFGRVENSFYGAIDEVSVYNRPLTAMAVLSLFNAGSAGKCCQPLPPTITVQPASQSANEGDEVSFAVSVTGSPPLSFQWHRYGTPIAGAAAATLTLPDAGAVDAGFYSVFATNRYGSVTSINAHLAITPLPDCADVPREGLAGWWCGESNAVDALSGNSGFVVNGAGFARGKVGHAFSFNGDHQLVQVADSNSLNPSNALSLECWIYVEQYSTNDGVAIAAKDDPLAGHRQYLLGLGQSGGKWVLGGVAALPGGSATIQGETPIYLKTWYHVAMTYDGAALRLYVNGVLDGSLFGAGKIKGSPAPFFIGGHPSGPWSFSGRVDELSLYHHALAPAEIRSIYNAGGAGKCPPRRFVTPLPSALVGLWSAESNVVDSVNAISGTALNGTSYAPGKVGTAFYFNGENQMVRVPNTAALNPANELTLECWVNVEQFPSNNWLALVAKTDPLAAYRQYSLGLATVGKKWVLRGFLGQAGGRALTEGTGEISVQTWYHVAMTYDGTDLRLYFNGVLDGSFPTAEPMTTTEFPLIIGGDGDGTSSFKGRLDEMGLYDRALTSKEIASHCLAGKAGKSMTEPRPSARDLRKWLFGGKQQPANKSREF